MRESWEMHGNKEPPDEIRNADPVCSEKLSGVKEAGAKRPLVLFVGASLGEPRDETGGAHARTVDDGKLDLLDTEDRRDASQDRHPDARRRRLR